MTIDSHSLSLSRVYWGVVDSKNVVCLHMHAQSGMCGQDLFFPPRRAPVVIIMLCVIVCVCVCVSPHRRNASS